MFGGHWRELEDYDCSQPELCNLNVACASDTSMPRTCACPLDNNIELTAAGELALTDPYAIKHYIDTELDRRDAAAAAQTYRRKDDSFNRTQARAGMATHAWTQNWVNTHFLQQDGLEQTIHRVQRSAASIHHSPTLEMCPTGSRPLGAQYGWMRSLYVATRLQCIAAQTSESTGERQLGEEWDVRFVRKYMRVRREAFLFAGLSIAL